MATILVVEDKDSLRLMLRKSLEAEGYDVDAARDGKEALDRIQGQRYELILTDLRLPRVDGAALLNDIR